MSRPGPTKLPYEPRRQKSIRPDRPLPPRPAEDPVEDPVEESDAEDVETVNAFEGAQAFTSPPSPPRQPAGLPPPPPPASAPTGGPNPPSSASSKAGAQTSASHLHPFHSSLPATAQQPPTTLTPLRAHYLKKSLVNLQVHHELTLLTDPVLGANALGLLGDPFTLSDSAKKEALSRVSEISRQEGRIGDLPFTRFLFHQFLLPFPFLATAPPTFWSAKVQPFLSSFLSTTGYSKSTSLSVEEVKMAEGLMTKEEKHEMEEKNKLWDKVEKHLALMVGVGVRLTSGEEVVRISQGDLRRLEQTALDRRVKWQQKHALPAPVVPGAPPPPGGASQVFEVNVVGVRVVMEKGRVRSKNHEEFLIRTRRSGAADVFVSRRYGDFRRLFEELRLAFPDYPLPLPPPKDKTSSASAVAAQSAQYGYYNPLRAIYGSGSPTPTNAASGRSSPNPDFPASSTSGPPVPLSREKNRLTLRSYLQTVLSLPYVVDSPIVRSFLLSSPTALTPSEAMDCQRRLEGDAVREEGRRRFREEAEKRIEALREGLAQFKGDVLSKEGGLKSVFDVVRRVDRVEDLPKAEASIVEWGRISLAATIFQLYVASDTASDTLAALKRIHSLVPYFMLKGILRISNPMAMIRGILDVFLARPFGGQSLIQRMFSTALNEDVRLITEDIDAVAEKVDDPVICQKIEHFASAPFEIQEIYRKDAASEGLDLLVVILRSPDMPSLSRPQFQRVFKASRAYREYKTAREELDDSDDDMGPESEDAWLFEDLNILLKLWLRRREKEQLLALIFEGTTAELLKDIITIFYAPLAQVYKAASIADSLGDLQNFLNDMIKTIEQVEEMSQENPQRTVQTFIDLVQRHEQAFYSFVHNVHSKGQGLFDSLMGWIELFLNYARDGLPQPVDLEFILPHGGPERQAVMAEVDAVAQYHYRLKVAHEEKLRRRFDKEPGGGQNAEEAALLDSVMASLSLGETTMGDGAELNEEGDEEDEFDPDDYDGSDVSSVRSAQAPPPKDTSNSTLRVPATLPTPDPVDPDLPHLSPMDAAGASANKDRTGSHNSSRVSLDKVRRGLHLDRHSPNPEESDNKQQEQDKDKRDKRDKKDKKDRKGGKEEKALPVPLAAQRPTSASRGPASEAQRRAKRARKARHAAAQELLVPPETPTIDRLRPLFVEVIRPLLKVKAIKT